MSIHITVACESTRNSRIVNALDLIHLPSICACPSCSHDPVPLTFIPPTLEASWKMRSPCFGCVQDQGIWTQVVHKKTELQNQIRVVYVHSSESTSARLPHVLESKYSGDLKCSTLPKRWKSQHDDRTTKTVEQHPGLDAVDRTSGRSNGNFDFGKTFLRIS